MNDVAYRFLLRFAKSLHDCWLLGAVNLLHFSMQLWNKCGAKWRMRTNCFCVHVDTQLLFAILKRIMYFIFLDIF